VDGRVACSRRHSFDVARSGYINLLQPQDRKSPRPGDRADVLAARRRFLAGGFETPLTGAILALLTPGPGDAVLEVGCGEGHYLAAIAARFGCEGYGLDISVTAIDAAARRHPSLHWVVANGDRDLPYADASFRIVASVTARRNAAEFRRVLRDDGTLLVVVPAPDDLIELRTAVLGEGISRDRVASTRESFAPFFTLARHERIRHVVRLDPGSIRDAMTASYRALRASQRARLAALADLDVTLSRDALLFRPAAAALRRGEA
jgi:SAM-dependent methyltransferase